MPVAAGDLKESFATGEPMIEESSMAAATVDRYWGRCGRDSIRRGTMRRVTGLRLRNSISIRKAGDELADAPSLLECDTVVHCGETLLGELVRTLTLTDVNTGRT